MGPQGEPGPVGSTGATGGIGPAGSVGPQGVPGPTGATGGIGATGPIGPIGPQGEPGPVGATGGIGAIGPAGPIGPQGLPGPQGPQFDPAGTDISAAVVKVAGAANDETLALALSNAVRIEAMGGASGGFDNTAILVKACALGVPVLFGPDTYVIDGECDIPTNAVLIGVPGMTVITRDTVGLPGAAALAVETDNNAAWIYFTGPSVTVHGIIFDANNALATSNTWGVVIGGAVKTSDFRRTLVRNVNGETYFQDGLRFLSNTNAGPHRLTLCGFTGNKLNGCTANAVQNITFDQCFATGNGQTGIQVDVQDPDMVLTASGIILRGNTATGNANGIQVGDPSIPGSSDPTKKYGTEYMRVLKPIIEGNITNSNGAGYDLIVSGCLAPRVTKNFVGSGGILSNCAIDQHIEGNDVEEGATFSAGRIGIDVGGSINPTITGNHVKGFILSCTPGGTTNARITGNRFEGMSGPAIDAQHIEGGSGGSFGLVSSGLTIDDNTIDYSAIAGASGVLLADALPGASLTNNKFIGPAGSSGVSGTYVGLHTSGNLLNGAPFSGTVSSAGALVMPAAAENCTISAAASATISTVTTPDAVSLAGTISAISVSSPGTGYDLNTTVVTISGNGTGATASAVVYGGGVIGIEMTNGGSGYTAATATITGPGTGATVVPIIGQPSPAFAPGRRIHAVNLTTQALTVSPGAITTPRGGASMVPPGVVASFNLDGSSILLAGTPDLTPESMGAVGNGVADDTAALNAWIAAVKATAPANASLSYALRKNAVYKVSNSVNFGFAGPGDGNPASVVHGNGATIMGTAPSGALVDFINFGPGTVMNDLKIVGVAGGGQQVGLLYGTSSAFVGNFVHRNTTIFGYFAYGCELNRGADICVAYNRLTANSNTTGIGQAIGDAGFSVIVDSQGQWPVTSAITTLEPITAGNSLQYKSYDCSDTGSAGSPYWFDTNVSPRFFSTYCNSVGATAVPVAVIYILQTLQAGAPWVHWDVHAEKIGSLSCMFAFKAPWATAGAQASIYFDHFYIKDQGFEGTAHLFVADANIALIRLSGFESDVLFQAGGTMFDQPGIYQIIGKIRHLSPAEWVAPALFTGDFESGFPASQYTFGNGVAWHKLTSIQGGNPLITLVGTGALNVLGPELGGTLLLQAGAFIGMSSAVVTAAGSTFATAVQCTGMYNVIEGSAAGGVIMPNVIGVETTYASQCSGAVTVYGPGGGVVATIAAGVTTPIKIFRFSATTYFIK